MPCNCLTNNAEGSTLKDEPTRTVGIRKRWIAQYNKRFRALKGRVNKLLLSNDNIHVQFINKNLATNAFEFTNDPEAVSEFMHWLQRQIDGLLFTNDATHRNIWQNKFIDQAYIRGIKASRAELKRLGAPPIFFPDSNLDIIGTATPSLGTGIGYSLFGTTANPIHLDAIRLLYIREFDALKGITNEMSKQISRVLIEGIEQGLGIRDIAKRINNRIDKIGISRARLLARTETVRAYNLSNIHEFESVADELGVEALFQWRTAGDGRVRSTHNARNNLIYTKEKVITLIGEPNCRCAIKPYIDVAEFKLAA